MWEAKLEPISYGAGTSACGDRRRKRESRMKPARQEKASGGRGRDRALALLSGMWEAKLEPISYSEEMDVAGACGEGERWQRALSLLSEIGGATLEPDVMR
ncbi:unnamed protein product [Prorocentrum cordatum]|uniref:Uncharacterized protein n=1 Tax=Prorocentrum cordatum TaxID=2364126 RepID=A0ABN9YA59_9DINO|nr:unnamed protein product [Polarella glacialis]